MGDKSTFNLKDVPDKYRSWFDRNRDRISITAIIVGLVAACGLGINSYVNACTGEWDLDCPDYQEDLADDGDEGRSEPVIDPRFPEFGNEDIDVTRYSLDLNYEPEEATLSGTADLNVRPVHSVKKLVLDFSDAMAVSDVVVRNDSVDFTQDGHKLTIDAPVSKGHPVSVMVEYSGTPTSVADPYGDGRVGAVVDEQSRSLRAHHQPYGAFTWFPTNELATDDVVLDVSIRVPEGFSAITGGEPNDEGGENEYTYSHSGAGSDMMLAIDEFDTFRVDLEPEVSVMLPPAHRAWKPALERLPKLQAFLDETFAPSGYDGLRTANDVVVIDGKSTMDVDGKMVVPGDVGKGDPAEQEKTLLHGLAEQAFPASSDRKDTWLHSGLTAYAETLWRVDKGEYTFAEARAEFEERDAKAREKYGPPGDPESDAVDRANTRVCPALMLMELADELGGRNEVNELLGQWARSSGAEPTRNEFIQFANAKTDKDLTKFFKSWLDSPTTPKTG